MFRRGVDALKFGRAVAHLHDGHAAPAPVEKLFAYAFEDGKRNCSRTCVEVVDALGGARAKGCLTHDVNFFFRVAFCCSSGELEIILGLPEYQMWVT